MHLRHLNPFPKNLEPTMKRFRHVAVAELNLGQLALILRATYRCEIVGLNKIQGQPFKVSEIISQLMDLFDQPEV